MAANSSGTRANKTSTTQNSKSTNKQSSPFAPRPFSASTDAFDGQRNAGNTQSLAPQNLVMGEPVYPVYGGDQQKLSSENQAIKNQALGNTNQDLNPEPNHSCDIVLPPVGEHDCVGDIVLPPVGQ